MKFVLTDACLLLDFHDLNLVAGIFDLDIQIVVSADLYADLPDTLKEILLISPACEKIAVYDLQEDECIGLYEHNFPCHFTHTDKTGLHLAKKLDLPVISSDPKVWKYPGMKSNGSCGFFWLLEQLVDCKILGKAEACQKLQEWMRRSTYRRDLVVLSHEVDLRLKKWA